MLGLSLWRPRTYQKTVSGIFSNDKMMLSHWIFFATAVLMNGMANLLGLIYYIMKDNAINDEE